MTLLLTGELVRRGWQVEVFLPQCGAFAEKLAAEQVPRRVVPTASPLRRFGGTTRGWAAVAAVVALPAYWWRLRRQFRGSEIVHVSSQRGLILAAVPARLAGARLVWHVHGIRRPQLLNLVGGLLADATIAVTPEVAQALPGRRLRPAPIVVPNPVDGRYLAVRPAPTSPPVLSTIARLHPEKGLDLLLRALVIVRSRRPDVTAVVIGEPLEGHEHHARELRALTRDLRLVEAVCFAGFVEDPRQALVASTIYVQPSRREGFGLAVLEAMAAGIPVVATEVEGLRRLVTDGLTGTLVRPEDPLALAEGILGVLEDPSEAERRAAEARDAVRKRYALEICVDRLTEVYAVLVDRPGQVDQPVQTMAATRSEVTPKETDRSNTTSPP